MPWKLSDRDKIDIVKLYTIDKLSSCQIAKKYDVRPSTIRGLLKRRDIKCNNFPSCRIYTIDESYLDVIDSEEKAYFLGFFYADGYNNKNGALIIELANKDSSILERFTVMFGSNNILTTCRRKKNPNYLTSRWQICSKKLHFRMIELGCPPTKTWTIRFPQHHQVPEYLIRHFIRGYFDGDGCINHKEVSFVSNEQFLLDLKNYIESSTPIEMKLKDISNTPAKRLVTNKHEYMAIFLNWMYKDASIYLNRKFNTYLKLKEKFFPNDILIFRHRLTNINVAA